jgi:hypothetical protein
MVIIDFFKGILDKIVNVTSFQCLTMLAIVAGLGFLYYYIRILIKMFNSKGVLIGILGCLFFPFTYIWGWVYKNEESTGETMSAWTILIISLLVFILLWRLSL